MSFIFKLKAMKAVVAGRIAAQKQAALHQATERKIERYEQQADRLNDKAHSIRENAQDRADAVREAYSSKADALREKGMHKLANLYDRWGENKAAKIEKCGELKAAKYEKLADKWQAKADRLKDKLGKDDDQDADNGDDDDIDDGDDGDNGDNGDDGADDDAATYDKVFFVNDPDANDGNGSGTIYDWAQLSDEDLANAGLDADAEPTFANYVAVFQATTWFNIEDLQEVRFYEQDEHGNALEITELRIEAPEGGFADGDELIAAYEDVVAAAAEMGIENLMISMVTDDDAPGYDEEEEDDHSYA